MALRKNASILSIAKHARIKAVRASIYMNHNPRGSIQHGVWMDCWNSLNEIACVMEEKAGLEECWWIHGTNAECDAAKIIRNMKERAKATLKSA